MKFDNLHQILRSLYEQMMPLCGDMAGVAKGIAGLGALFYVAYRVWQSLARAEPIDVFPMLRPFAIGLCIMFFPTVVLGTINSILSPVVQGTAKMPMPSSMMPSPMKRFWRSTLPLWIPRPRPSRWTTTFPCLSLLSRIPRTSFARCRARKSVPSSAKTEKIPQKRFDYNNF